MYSVYSDISTLSVIEVQGLLFVRWPMMTCIICSIYAPFGEGTEPREIDESERVSLSDERDHTRA
ncbi:hypothetical protein ASPTUDRAFT_40468 [Aspergillus tubingensis CBS 134.48]|uniref:Uncharacterized protein n=1 Tax=Aspergillus tubingensis (strain CBS 134.48) TaxID=767770 RepID=A0A1L9NDN2_ASPTC|nr:hypothetical protein ASPTUDRAFT_40468 [Aspergillus tubingensis CBS 134.48]